jgi:tungstate transport system permease protein
MSEIWNGLTQAFWLVATLDQDLIDIAGRSLQVTCIAVLISSIIGLPLGAWLTVYAFRLRRVTIAILNALMGLPPVAIGLIVYVTLSNSGPLGVLNLLFTPTAMIVAQVIIITPLVASIAHQSMQSLWREYRDLMISVNATRTQSMIALIKDGRRALLTATLAGFGRGIGEVGAIMIVGGNIDQATRVLTTAISLETSKGNFGLAMGLGFILIALAIMVNFVVHFLTRPEEGEVS